MKYSELKKHKDIILLGLLTVFIAIFILSNSLLDYEKSHYISNQIADIVLSNEKATFDIDYLVRRFAHLFEFCSLGITSFIALTKIKKQFNIKLFGYALFFVLFIAVIDEFIQSFSNRTSSVGDILLDLCGSILGFLIGYIIIRIYKHFKFRHII